MRYSSELSSHPLRFWVLVGLVGLAPLACGKGDGLDGELDCGDRIADDQRGSLQPRLAKRTVEIRASRGWLSEAMTIDSSRSSRGSRARTSSETRAAVLERVTSEWNRVGNQVQGQDFFRMSYGDLPGGAGAAGPGDCASVPGGQDYFYIVLETSEEGWRRRRFPENAVGVTIRCASGNQLSHQIVVLNGSKLANEQFASVILHELGHAIGLDHSCVEGQGSGDFRGCSGLQPQHAYRQAVLYPTLLRNSSEGGALEVKEELRQNDQERAACLYQR